MQRGAKVRVDRPVVDRENRYRLGLPLEQGPTCADQSVRQEPEHIPHQLRAGGHQPFGFADRNPDQFGCAQRNDSCRTGLVRDHRHFPDRLAGDDLREQFLAPAGIDAHSEPARRDEKHIGCDVALAKQDGTGRDTKPSQACLKFLQRGFIKAGNE